MPYPASTQTLETWTEQIDRQFILLKNSAVLQNSASAAGTLDMDSVRRFFDLLVASNVFCNAVAAVPGIGDYVTAQKQGQGGDPVAAFQATQTAIVSTLNWLRTNLPSGSFDAANYALAFFLPVDNVTQISALKFTAAETANYRTMLTALIGTIS